MSSTEPQSDGVPEWEREPVTVEQACQAVLDEVYDIEGMQRLLAHNRAQYPGLLAPSPTAMRRAHVLRYAATVLQIVHENSEEFKQMIASKRARARKKRDG